MTTDGNRGDQHPTTAPRDLADGESVDPVTVPTFDGVDDEVVGHVFVLTPLPPMPAPPMPTLNFPDPPFRP